MDILLNIVAFILGRCIYINNLKPLTLRYNYKIRRQQVWTLIFTIIAIAAIIFEYSLISIPLLLKQLVLSMLIYALIEFILSKLNPKSYIVCAIFRIGFVLLISYLFGNCITASLIAGIICTNSPLGVVFPKFQWHPLKRAKALDLQALIDKTISEGKQVVTIPKGRYEIKGLIQINQSNFTLQGETDEQGEPLTELICTNSTVNGKCNPWISPFFITTGEHIQPSNIFWGLDFNKKQNIRMESSSLSDPGSDGNILTPSFATTITEDAKAGTTVLQVEDSNKVGKYILLGMYNTTRDGNLIKDILGVNELRKEWVVANRAGNEEAPSFQWLVQVKQIIDVHTIELAVPLPRDCSTIYTPKIFNAEMLENIVIKDLKLESKWNGLFRHHGFPLYYSVPQSQEMDYGWNAINMKRVVNGKIENIIIKNFTNPLYIMDSLNCIAEHITIKGYDGHQGIKLYSHSCNNLVKDIHFLSHFADMMGGEGNAYCNTFEGIEYCNPSFKPVDFDFHGFTEGPMSPPAYNSFCNIKGFRYVKGAGAISHLPSCARGNTWRQIKWEGEKKGLSNRFIALNYRKRSFAEKYISALGFTIVKMLKEKKVSVKFFSNTFTGKIKDIQALSIPQEKHQEFFPDNFIYN